MLRWKSVARHESPFKSVVEIFKYSFTMHAADAASSILIHGAVSQFYCSASMDGPLQLWIIQSSDWRINYLIWKMELARSDICLDNQRASECTSDMPSSERLVKPNGISQRRQLLRAVVGSLRCMKDEESTQIRRWSVEAERLSKLRQQSQSSQTLWKFLYLRWYLRLQTGQVPQSSSRL